MKFKNWIKEILLEDKVVSHYNKDREWKNQVIFTWIAIIGSLIMSVMNILQHSTMMLYFTGGTAVFLLCSFLIGIKNRKVNIPKIAFNLVFSIIFTIYVIKGGNDGFAALWLILAPYVLVAVIDLKIGFVACIYYLFMLFLCMKGPLSYLIEYHYSEMFLSRFPLLYLINFIFAIMFAIRMRQYQYELIKGKEEVERLSTIDISTGVENRNGYNLFLHHTEKSRVRNMAVIYIDVNGLHDINNRYGHEMGDKMLSFIASLCEKYFKDEKIFRIGGDEFVIITEHLKNIKIDEKMKLLLKEVEDKECSIAYGIAAGHPNIELDKLVVEADYKMLENKRKHYEMSKYDRRKGSL